MELIKRESNVSKGQLMDQYYAARGAHIDVSDQERAFNLAVSVLLSINCGKRSDHADDLEKGQYVLTWRNELSVTALVQETFKTSSDLATVQSKLGSKLTAKHLCDKTGLQFRATEDIRSHLRIDFKNQTVYLFHHTALLEEMLKVPFASQNEILPRQMLLEILHTLYDILFPYNDESIRFASYLTKRHGFKEGFLRGKIHGLRRDGDPEVDYSYFGDRLVELHKELEDPKPRNCFQRLFDDGPKVSNSKMLMYTTIGVFIAVTIGFFGLVIAVFQAWVGYQQWKHPVNAG